MASNLPETANDIIVEQPGGLRGRVAAHAESAIDAVANVTGQSSNAHVGQAKAFVRSKPYAVAALAGVIGLALLNTLRGKR